MDNYIVYVFEQRVLSQSDKVCCVWVCVVQSWEKRLKIKHCLIKSLRNLDKETFQFKLPPLKKFFILYTLLSKQIDPGWV